MTQALVRDLVTRTLNDLGDDPVGKTLSEAALTLENHPGFSDETFSEALRELENLGPLESLMNDESVSEILVNDFDMIFFEKAGKLFKHEKQFSSRLTFKRLLDRLLIEIEKVADKRHPLVDGTLKNGCRVNIALPPITRTPTLSLRKHTFSQWCLDDLVCFKMLNSSQAEILKTWVREKKNILVSGSTSSGKTTMLRALARCAEPLERIITIEDTLELGLDGSQNLSLVTREDPEGLVPAIDLNRLLKNSLRMRPDRLIVGEIRGEECLTFLDALATGHSGSMSSIHGGSASQALLRLESLISRAAPQWPMAAIRQLVFDGVDCVVHLEKQNGLRVLSQAAQIEGVETFGYLLTPAF